MFRIKFILIFLLFIFFSSCSRKIVEKSIIKEKDIELEMIEAYQEGLRELKRGDVLYAADSICASLPWKPNLFSV